MKSDSLSLDKYVSYPLMTYTNFVLPLTSPLHNYSY